MRPVLPWFHPKASRGDFKLAWVVLFTLPFLIGGLVCLWALTVRPTMDWLRAQSWHAVDAVIEKAWLAVIPGDDNDSRKVEVRFRYPYHGTTHVGTRHSFSSASSNIGVGGKEQVVESLPPGKTVTCWVNPADPNEAVLDRSLPSQAILGLFFATPFITVGVTGFGILARPWLRWSLSRRRKAQLAGLVDGGRLPDWVLLPFSAQADTHPDDVTLIIAADQRLPLALGMTFLNLTWNGLVGAFVCGDVAAIAGGDGGTGLFLSLFLLPFVAIGIGILWTGIKLWRLTWRPGWVAALRPAPDLEGGEATFCWAWLDAQREAHPPQAMVRIVAQAAHWDEESNSPSQVISRKRRTKLSDPAASKKSELELAAVEVPILDAPKEIPVTLPWVPFPSADFVPRPRWQPKADWGGWWQLEVTYRDGEVELAELTKAEKLLI